MPPRRQQERGIGEKGNNTADTGAGNPTSSGSPAPGGTSSSSSHTRGPHSANPSTAALTFQSLQGVYQPRNLPASQGTPAPSKEKDRASGGSPHESPTMQAQPQPAEASPVEESLATMAAPAMVVTPAGPSSLFTLNADQTEVVAAINPAERPQAHSRALYPSDMGPLKPTGKRGMGLGLPSGSHIKRRPPSVGRHGGNNRGGRPPVATAAGGAGGARDNTGDTHAGEILNAYGSPSTAALQMGHFASPLMAPLGMTVSGEYLNTTLASQAAQQGSGTGGHSTGTAGANLFSTPGTTSLGAGGKTSTGAAGRAGREARPIVFDRRADPSPAPSRPARANRRKQQLLQQQQNAAGTHARSSSHATPGSTSLALGGGLGAAHNRYGRQHSDTVLVGTPHREDMGSRPAKGAGTLQSLKRPPSGRSGVPSSGAAHPGTRGREEAVQAYLSLCEELGETPNPDWVAVFVKPPSAFTAAGPRDSFDAQQGGSGAGSPVQTPHLGSAFTPKGTTGAHAPGRTLSGRRPQISSTATAGRLDPLTTSSGGAGGGTSGRAGAQKRAKSPGTGRAAAATSGGAGKRSASVGRITSNNRPNISLNTNGPTTPHLHSSGARTPHAAGGSGARSMADIYLDRMTAYCEQHLRPYHSKMEVLRQRRLDVGHAVDNFLGACKVLEATEAAQSATADGSSCPAGGDRVQASTESIGSKGSGDKMATSTESVQELTRAAQSLTEGLGEVQSAVVQLLLNLGECASEAHKPLGATAGMIALGPSLSNVSQPYASSAGIPGSDLSQPLGEDADTKASPALTPPPQENSSVPPSSDAAVSPSSGLPTIPPLGIQEIFHKALIHDGANHQTGTNRVTAATTGGPLTGATAASSSLPQTPSVPTAPQGFVEFVTQQEREIAEELRGVRDVVREALESTPYVHIVDENILKTPLFCPAYSPRSGEDDGRSGSPRLPASKLTDATTKTSGKGSRRSSRTSTSAPPGGSAAAGANRTPRTAANLFGTPATNTPRQAGGGRTPRNGGSSTTPRGSKAAATTGKTSASNKDRRRQSSGGNDETPRSKRNSTAGLLGSGTHPLTSTPIFAVVTDVLASQRTDASLSSASSPLHGAAQNGGSLTQNNTSGGSTTRPLLVLGGGSTFAAAALASARSAGQDSLAGTVTTANADGSSRGSPPAAAAPTQRTSGAAAKGRRANGPRMRSSSAGAGKRGGGGDAAGKGATPAKPGSASAAVGAGSGSGTTATKRPTNKKESKKARASAAGSPPSVDLNGGVLQLEKARHIWHVITAEPTTREQEARQRLDLRPVTFPSYSPQMPAIYASLDSAAGDSAAALSTGGGKGEGSVSLNAAAMTPPTMTMSATNVFHASSELAAVNADADSESTAGSPSSLRATAVGGKTDATQAGGNGSKSDATNSSTTTAALAGPLATESADASANTAPLEAGERTAKPSQKRSPARADSDTPLPKPAREILDSVRSAGSPPGFEPATEPAKQRDRHHPSEGEGNSLSSPDKQAAAQPLQKGPPKGEDPSRKLRLDEVSQEDVVLLHSPGSSSFLSAQTDNANARTPPPTGPLGHSTPQRKLSSASTARPTSASLVSVSRADAVSRIAKCWRAYAARSRIRQERTAAAATLAAERQRQVLEGRVRRFLVWVVRRRRLRTALAIMHARAMNDASATASAGSPTKSAPAAIKKKKAAAEKPGKTAGSQTSTAAALAALKAAEQQAREQRLAEFVKLLTEGCTTADVPDIVVFSPSRHALSTPPANSPIRKGAASSSPTTALTSRDRFQQAREQRKNIKGGVASSPNASRDSPRPAGTSANTPTTPKPSSSAAAPVPPKLPLLSHGISTKAIVSYNSDAENFEVSVMHRLLRAPQPLLFIVRTAADRYPVVPPMGYARLKEAHHAASRARGGGTAGKGKEAGLKPKKAPPTASMSPDREASPSMPRPGTDEDAELAAQEARQQRLEKKRKEEKKAGVYTIPYAKLRKYMHYHATLGGAANAGTPSWSSPLSPGSPLDGNISATSSRPPRPVVNNNSSSSNSASASPSSPTTAPLLRQRTIPLSVRYESYIDANELGNDMPVVKSFTRPFERWGTAYSMTRRIFTAAAIYAWKLLFSHTPHDDFKQRQLRTEEERQSRLERVMQRNTMILACYCVRSEREWLREASKDLSFVGQIWNPKKFMNPNDPDLDRHCRETYAFVEDFLYQCFPTANSLDDVPPFLVGAGIYFVLKEVFHTGAGVEEDGISASAISSSASPTEANNFAARYPDLTVSAVDISLEEGSSNETSVGGGRPARGRAAPPHRAGHGGGRLTEYQRRTVQSYELIDLIDRMSQWHYASVNNTRKRQGGKEKEDKKAATVVLGGEITHDDGFFMENPLGSGEFDSAADNDNDASSDDALGTGAARRDDSQVSFDALAATWASTAGDHVARGAASLATPTIPHGMSNELRTFVSPMTKLQHGSSGGVSSPSGGRDMHSSGRPPYHAPTMSNMSHLSTPPAHTILSGEVGSGNGTSAGVTLGATYHHRILSNVSSNMNGRSLRPGEHSTGAPVDGMADIAISRVKLVKVPETALHKYTPDYHHARKGLKARESEVFTALARLARSQEKTHSVRCRELAVLYPKRFLVTLSEKLCFELLGLRLDLEVCEDLDCVE